MPDAIDLGPDDVKLVTLARSARARNNAAEGAAVRDDTGRTYVGTSVDLASLSLSALQAAVVIAVASGAVALEAAAVVSAEVSARTADLAIVAETYFGQLKTSAAINPDLCGPVHEHVGDAGLAQQRLERAGADQFVAQRLDGGQHL